jgi:23S rRNA (uracil1939-C5)-methyltransferase
VSVTLDIQEMGVRGDGIAEEQGRRWFVPFTLPGETVHAEPRDQRGGGVAAELVEVLAPSRHRVKPPCPHFGLCGNCALQHWRLDAYAAWKAELIARALSQQGVKAPPFEPMLQGAPYERRRADVIVRRGLAGFHERGTHRAFNVEACPVLRPALLGLLPALRSLLDGDVAADAIVNETDSGLDVLIRPHRRLALPLEANQRLVAFAHAADLARLSWGDRTHPDPIAVRRTPRLTFGPPGGGVSVDPPPGVFLQATRRAEQAMRDAAATWLSGARRVADLFAGVGALSLGQPWRATLYESDKAAVDAVAKLGAVRRDLFRNPLLASELKPFDAVLLDPPRAGAAAQVAELATSAIGRIVYASCDPGTFARDARTLQESGYRLEKLRPIDQFLWSAHVELIALFAR